MGRNSVGFCAAIAGVVLAGASAAVRASAIAADSSTNYPTYSDFNATNYGTGFGTWSVTQSGSNGGDYVDSAANGGFDLWENGAQASGGATTDTITAVRPFSGGALASNQGFTFQEELHYASNPTNGGPSNLGFSLEDSSGNPLFNFNISGGGTGYVLSDATQTDTQTNVYYNYNTQDTFSFVLNNAATGAYTFTVTGSNGNNTPTETFTGTISTATGGISQFAIYNNNGGYGSDFHFDNLSITSVPEPASLALAALGGLSTLGLRRRRVSA